MRHDVAVIDVEPWRDIITGTTVQEVRREIRRGLRRREFAGVGPVRYVRPGVFACPVIRVREPYVRPAWIKPATIAGAALLSVAGLAGLGWWLLSATAALVTGAGIGSVMFAGALVFAAERALRGGGCSTTVTVRHRH